MTATQDLDCRTAGAVAVRAQLQSGVKMSFSTTTRYFRNQGLQHLRPRTVPILTAKHRAARLAFAKAAVRSTFQRALITDSRIVWLAPMARPAGRWCTSATRGTVANHITVRCICLYGHVLQRRHHLEVCDEHS